MPVIRQASGLDDEEDSQGIWQEGGGGWRGLLMNDTYQPEIQIHRTWRACMDRQRVSSKHATNWLDGAELTTLRARSLLLSAV